MTPDQMRQKILEGSRRNLPAEGMRTLWLATSDEPLHGGPRITDHVMRTGLKISAEGMNGAYVDLMIRQHQAHILGASAKAKDDEGREILVIDVVSANRRTIHCAHLDEFPEETLRRWTEGVFEDADVPRYQEIIRRNVMENEGAA